MPTPAAPPFQRRPGYANSGWTVFAQAAGAKTIYVAPSSIPGATQEQGSDGQCGFAPSTVDANGVAYTGSSSSNQGANPCPGYAHTNHGLPHGPKAGFSAGYNLWSNNSSDWLLFRCGGVWSMSGETILGRNGSSASTPTLFSSYETAASGNARPAFWFPQTPTSGGQQQAGFQIGASRIAIAHIEVNKNPAHAYILGTRGCIQTLNGYSNILIEGCYVTGRDIGIDFTQASGVARRNVVYYCHSSGILCFENQGVTFEENFIYRIGEQYYLINSSVSPHGIYVTNEDSSGSYILRDNLLSDVSYSALDARHKDGTVEGNVVVASRVGIELGADHGEVGIDVLAQRNVILDARHPFSGGDGNYGIRIAQGNGHQVLDNIVANCTGSHNAGQGIWFFTPPGYVSQNTTIRSNIVYNWGGNPFVLKTDSGASIATTTLEYNDFQDSRQAQPIGYSHLNDALTTAAFTVSRGNRYWNAGLTPPTSGAFKTGNGTNSKTLTQWNLLIGDSSPASTSGEVTYPDAANAKIEEYAKKVTSGTITDHDTFMRYVRDNYSRAKWKPNLSAKAINAWMRQRFGL